MNWIQFYGFDKIEVLDEFKYIGPLSKKDRVNMWSNFSYYSIKIKCPSNIHLIGLKGKSFRDVIYKKNGVYYDAQFSIQSIRGLSDNKDHKIIKLEVEGLELNEIQSKEIQRDLKLSDLFIL
jgi:hypothetical protein